MNANEQKIINLIKYPILTEKTIRLIEQNQYSFAVDIKSKKPAIKFAIEKIFCKCSFCKHYFTTY